MAKLVNQIVKDCSDRNGRKEGEDLPSPVATKAKDYQESPKRIQSGRRNLLILACSRMGGKRLTLRID
jgi:hypothetical protein